MIDKCTTIQCNPLPTYPITQEVAEKNHSPTVSQFQTLPVSRPVLLTLAIPFEILYMLFTLWEHFGLKSAQLYEIKPNFYF